MALNEQEHGPLRSGSQPRSRKANGLAEELLEPGALAVNPDFDITQPNVARIYDYILGGKDNFPVDRAVGDELLRVLPEVQRACHQNRYFLQRVVQFLVTHMGIRQIIDIGTGLPTRGNVHEVAQNISPDVRVVYVDYDPIVIAHANALLVPFGKDAVAARQADIRKPQNVINAVETTGLIDFTQPVAVLMFAILHFIPDDEDPGNIVSQLASVLAPESYIAISHMTDDEVEPDRADAAVAAYKAAETAVPRSAAEIMLLFGDLKMVPPGLVSIDTWPMLVPSDAKRPRAMMYGGVGCKEY
jgi:SAM-dependent methyltransferase